MHKITETLKHQTVWTVTKYADDEAYRLDKPFEISRFEGNMLLNEGIQNLWDLGIASGTPTSYANANARIGVGDSSTGEAATQTDLQAATNKLYKAMEATYPLRSNQTVTFRSVFGSAEANYDWNEFSVDNGAAASKNLNRKVSAQGSKVLGQTWTVDVAITLS